MRKQKSGQATAGSAALLVAIIAAMILLYTLFLPPEERAKLLEDDSQFDDSDRDGLKDTLILLKASPGRLDLIKNDEIEHKISPFNLISFTEAKLLKEASSIYVEKGVSSEKTYTLSFDTEDTSNTDNVLLSFVNSDHRGRLIITLNGQIISETEIKETNPTPIELPKAVLAKSNFLQFSVSSPGALFFLKNSYTLENVRIVGDITSKDGLTNTQSFVITEVEKENIEKATMSFMITCKSDDVGKLQILLNNQRVYSGIPSCELPIRFDISEDKFLEGQNDLTFSSEKGSYLLDQIMLRTFLKEATYRTYYFEMEEDDFKDMQDGDIDVNMSIIFVKPKEDFQDVEVEINGRKFSIDNKDRIYNEVINPYVREGNNAITLRPLDGTVEVVELKIFMVNMTEEDDP